MVYLEMWPKVVNEYTNKWSKNTDHANKGARWEGSNRFHCEDEVVFHLESNWITLTFATTENVPDKTVPLQKTVFSI